MTRMNYIQSVTAILAALLSTVARSADVQYEFIELPPAGGDYSSVLVVNDLGHALVEIYGDDGAEGAVFWSKETGYRYIFDKQSGIWATAMNNYDQVVGRTDDGLCAIWTPDGSVTTFDAPDGYDVYPGFIDDDGQVFGVVVEKTTYIRHAFHVSSEGIVVVDRPAKSTCLRAVDNKHGAVIQVMESPSTTCSCSEPQRAYFVHDQAVYRIAAPGHKSLCTHAMDNQGDVLVTDDAYDDSPALWSRSGGYVPLGINVGTGNLAGVADGGIVAANGELDGQWQAFLWDRKSGARAVKDMIRPRRQIEYLTIKDVSAHGVLGGDDFLYPVILLPSHWTNAERR